MAEGAVRRPSGRLTPLAAQRRSERSCRLRSLSDQSRTEALRAKACMTGNPLVLFGSLSLIVLSSGAWARLRAKPRSRMAARHAARRDLLMGNLLFFDLITFERAGQGRPGWSKKGVRSARRPPGSHAASRRRPRKPRAILWPRPL